MIVSMLYQLMYVINAQFLHMCYLFSCMKSSSDCVNMFYVCKHESEVSTLIKHCVEIP